MDLKITIAEANISNLLADDEFQAERCGRRFPTNDVTSLPGLFFYFFADRGWYISNAALKLRLTKSRRHGCWCRAFAHPRAADAR